MAKVKIHIYPPLSFQITNKESGESIIDKDTKPGETIGSLFNRLVEDDYQAWSQLYNTRTNQVRGVILVSLNGKVLFDGRLKTRLSDGDHLSIRVAYFGG